MNSGLVHIWSLVFYHTSKVFYPTYITYTTIFNRPHNHKSREQNMTETVETTKPILTMVILGILSQENFKNHFYLRLRTFFMFFTSQKDFLVGRFYVFFDNIDENEYSILTIQK